jgi:IclR family acetate operon transcriptional repressor
VSAAPAVAPAAAPGTDGRKLIASVERALDVLGVLAAADGPDLGVTEVARSLDLSKAVVHRLLTTLASRGFVEVEPASRRYRLGPTALTLGSAYLDRIDLIDLVRPRLRDLSAATGETATMSLRHGWHRVYVDQVIPDREVRMEVALGRPFPLHAGSSSKAFLAHLDKDDRAAYLAQPLLEALTPATKVDIAILGPELEEIRRGGIARSLGERQTGAASIAAPILDVRDVPVAVVSIGGPIERFTASSETAARLLLETTTALSRALGHRSRARG